MQCVSSANHSIPDLPCVVFSIAFASSEFNLRFAYNKKKSFLLEDWPIFLCRNTQFCLHYKVLTSMISYIFGPIVCGWTHKHVCPTVYMVDLQCSTHLYSPSNLSKQKETSVFLYLKYWLIVGWGCVKVLHQARGTVRTKKIGHFSLWKELHFPEAFNSCLEDSWRPVSFFSTCFQIEKWNYHCSDVFSLLQYFTLIDTLDYSFLNSLHFDNNLYTRHVRLLETTCLPRDCVSNSRARWLLSGTALLFALLSYVNCVDQIYVQENSGQTWAAIFTQVVFAICVYLESDLIHRHLIIQSVRFAQK